MTFLNHLANTFCPGWNSGFGGHGWTGSLWGGHGNWFHIPFGGMLLFILIAALVLHAVTTARRPRTAPRTVESGHCEDRPPRS